MNDEDIAPHKSVMMAGSYVLDDERFARLKQWHGVLFQLASASHYLDQLKGRKENLGNLEDFYEAMALFSAFILQYSKCFTSGGNGQVTLDENKIYAPNSGALATHKRILNIRHNLIAHNGNSDLIVQNIGIKELDDRFVARHFLTFAIPMNELVAFEEALETTHEYSVRALNKHLDSIGERLGKIVLFSEAS